MPDPLVCYEDVSDGPCDEPAVAYTRDHERAAELGRLAVYPVCGRHARTHWRDLVAIEDVAELAG